MNIDFAERLEGGVWGLLIGDALGVPYEFHSPESLAKLETIDMVPSPDFGRSHASVPPGTWSDDGAHALCLLSSLLDCGELNPRALAGRLLAWRDHGYMAVDGHVFDIGIQTGVALRALESGAEPLSAGPRGVRDNGNGSLMRVLPLALWHRGSDGELIRDAMDQSRVTHGHARACVCCALYCLWARRILTGSNEPWGDATATLRLHFQSSSSESSELERHICPDTVPAAGGSGYVVDSLHSARQVLAVGDYAKVVRAAVALGNDTDTTACIAGGIAGVRDGIQAIPGSWKAQLRGTDMFEPLLERLLEWHSRTL